MAQTNSTTVEVSEYDMIDRAGCYEIIEEVEAKDDILFLAVSQRQGPLPSPGYSGLMLDEPKPPSVYSRMDHQEKLVWESDVDRNDPQSDIDGSMHDLSNFPKMVDATVKIASPVNSCLVQEAKINTIEDLAVESEELSSTDYLVTPGALQSNMNNYVQEDTQDYEIPSSYLTTIDMESSAAVQKITSSSYQF